MKFSKKLAAGVVAGLTVMAGTAAFGAIPDAGGTIHACYGKNSGTLRVTDTATNKPKPCTKNENPLTITPGQPGPKGDKGDPGIVDRVTVQRENTDALLPIDGATKVVNSWGGGVFDGGNKHISAKVVVGSFDAHATAWCELRGFPGDFPIDKAFVTLISPYPGGPSAATVHLEGAASFAIEHLQCDVSNGYATDAVVTMTKVNEIDAN